VNDRSPYEIVAPAPPRRFKSAAELTAYYAVNPIKNREELIALAEMIHHELDKINDIISDVVRKLEEDKANQNA
jgi:hypothetical protein